MKQGDKMYTFSKWNGKVQEGILRTDNNSNQDYYDCQKELKSAFSQMLIGSMFNMNPNPTTSIYIPSKTSSK